jgi:outer membrane protein assembly factor BamD
MSKHKGLSMKQAKPILAATLMGALILSGGLGCRRLKLKEQKDPNEGIPITAILARGEIQLQKKKWEEGRKTLRFIEENYPSSAEFPKAKILIGDSFFFSSTSEYPEALVEYQSFLNYFPKHELRDYALYRSALCHYAGIESAERDQSATHKAIAAFEQLLRENPGSVYAVDARSKITQCWRRLAESELMVGIFYVKSYHFAGAERRLKQLLETYPDYVDRERAYYFLGEAMRRKTLPGELLDQFTKDFIARVQKPDYSKLTKAEQEQYRTELNKLAEDEIAKYRQEGKSYYQKLVESYPASEWAGRARDRLLEMGQADVKEELDS